MRQIMQGSERKMKVVDRKKDDKNEPIILRNITESCPLKNVARENANKLEKRKRACVTSRRPVNPTVSHVIPDVCCVHKYCFLLRQPKRSAIHQRRIDVISGIILIGLYCLKIGQMKN